MENKLIHGNFIKGVSKDLFIRDDIDNALNHDTSKKKQSFIPYYEVIVYKINELDEFKINTTIHKFQEIDLLKSKQSSNDFIRSLSEVKNVDKSNSIEYELTLVSKSSTGEQVKYLIIDKKGVNIKRGAAFEEYLLAKLENKI